MNAFPQFKITNFLGDSIRAIYQLKCLLYKVMGLSLCIALLISGCALILNPAGHLSEYVSIHSDSTKVLMADVVLDYRSENAFRLNKTVIIKVGKDPTDLIPLLQVVESPMREMNKYELKILDQDGDYERVGRDQLMEHALSGVRGLNERRLLTPGIDFLSLTNAVLELKVEQTYTLPELGYTFYPYAFLEGACSISFSMVTASDGPHLEHLLLNDELSPEIESLDGNQTTRYTWDSLPPLVPTRRIMRERQTLPKVFVSTFPLNEAEKSDSLNSPWTRWGDWYLELISHRLEPSPQHYNLASEVTKGATTDLLKLIRIFNFCREEIRYEQVYEEYGEFIPNTIEDILTNGYGDCKDYSLLIHMLAKSVGIQTDLALCYRGRGTRFYPEMVSSQFNHMIVHYELDGIHYWMDGTNRISSFGITATDLNNQVALLLIPGASRLKSIENNVAGQLNVMGELNVDKTALRGPFVISFEGQYAIELNYVERVLAKDKFKNFISGMVYNLTSDEADIESISSYGLADKYVINCDLSFGNAILKHNEYSYVRPSTVFQELKSQLSEETVAENLFFYPLHGEVELGLTIQGLRPAGEPSQTSFHWSCDYSIPLGPYTTQAQQAETFQHISDILTSLNTRHKMKEIQP